MAAVVVLLCLTLEASSTPLQASDGYCLLSYGTVLRRAVAEHKASNATPDMRAKVHHDSMPLAAWRAFEAVADSKRELLEKGSEEAAQPWLPEARGSVFEAVEVSLPLEPPVLKHSRSTGSGQGDKNIVGLGQLTRDGRRCVVYGMGIADDSSFEQQMQQLGCETHAFDCTVSPSSPAIVGKSFHFHNWCIGHQGGISFADNKYVHDNKDALQFKSLPDTMKMLNHTHIDLLKFDIEGFEWQLFQSQILTSDNPPEQLSFELHTQKANPAYVPHGNVHDKGYVEVNRLFRSLYDLGYRVTSKELNSGDPACAEFVAVRVNRDDA
jgi:hypothetical protein